MAYGLKRIDLQRMAEAKLDDALLLLKHNRWSNAYYMAGYAVEIGLKACIATQVSAETIPDKAFLKKVMNHEFPVLIGLAGLQTALKEQQDSDADFAVYWAIAAEWSPDSRYEIKDSASAQFMAQAVSHPTSGVLQWIKRYW